jgi:hypothetical protein
MPTESDPEKWDEIGVRNVAHQGAQAVWAHTGVPVPVAATRPDPQAE